MLKYNAHWNVNFPYFLSLYDQKIETSLVRYVRQSTDQNLSWLSILQWFLSQESICCIHWRRYPRSIWSIWRNFQWQEWRFGRDHLLERRTNSLGTCALLRQVLYLAWSMARSLRYSTLLQWSMHGRNWQKVRDKITTEVLNWNLAHGQSTEPQLKLTDMIYVLKTCTTWALCAEKPSLMIHCRFRLWTGVKVKSNQKSRGLFIFRTSAGDALLALS